MREQAEAAHLAQRQRQYHQCKRRPGHSTKQLHFLVLYFSALHSAQVLPRSLVDKHKIGHKIYGHEISGNFGRKIYRCLSAAVILFRFVILLSTRHSCLTLDSSDKLKHRSLSRESCGQAEAQKSVARIVASKRQRLPLLRSLQNFLRTSSKGNVLNHSSMCWA